MIDGPENPCPHAFDLTTPDTAPEFDLDQSIPGSGRPFRLGPDAPSHSHAPPHIPSTPFRYRARLGPLEDRSGTLQRPTPPSPTGR